MRRLAAGVVRILVLAIGPGQSEALSLITTTGDVAVGVRQAAPLPVLAQTSGGEVSLHRTVVLAVMGASRTAG